MPYKRGNKWIAQIRISGKKYRKTLLTKKDAIEWEVSKKKSLMQISNQEIPSHCLLDWATEYLEYCKSRFVDKVFKEKHTVFKRFFKFISPDILPHELTLGIVLRFLQVQNNKRSGCAANRDRKNLVAAWNWGIKYIGLPSKNPCLVDKFPENRSPRYVPPESDFWKVFHVAESKQDQILLLAYFQLAARKQELFNLRWEDVDFEVKRIRIYTRKRKDGSLEFDWLPILDELFSLLVELHDQSVSDWVFPDPKTGLPYIARFQWMRRLCEKAGVKRFGTHGIRHLSSSILANGNVPMVDIQTILRHKNLSTTERYIKRINSLRPSLGLLAHRGKQSPLQEPTNKKRG